MSSKSPNMLESGVSDNLGDYVNDETPVGKKLDWHLI